MREVKTNFVNVSVWLEGVLFPFAKSVSVNYSPEGATCQIDIPPSSTVRPERWAGMMVHVFFATPDVLAHFNTNYDHRARLTNPEDLGWPILFQGEVRGVAENESVSSESLTISAVGHSKHFKQTQMFFWDAKSLQYDAAQQAAFMGSSKINIELEGVLSKRSNLLNGLVNKIKSVENIPSYRNIAFTAMVLEILRMTKDQHAMFTYIDNKLKLTQRFGAFVDPDVRKILALEQLSLLIDQTANTLPSHASILDILEMAAGIVQYNWVHIGQPILRRRIGDNETRTDSSAFTQPVIDDEVAESIRKAVDIFFTQGNAVNDNVSTAIGLIQAPANYFNPSFTKKNISIEIFVDKVIKKSRGFVETQEVSMSAFEIATIQFRDLLDQGYFVPRTSGTLKKKNPVKKEDKNPANAQEEEEITPNFVKDQEEEQDRATPIDQVLEGEQALLTQRDELTEFIVTPDMMFSQPPKCNVFTPSNITSSGIQRDFSEEITRLYAQVFLMPASSANSAPAIEWYIAPYSQQFFKLSADRKKTAIFSDAYQEFIADQQGSDSDEINAEALEGFEGGFTPAEPATPETDSTPNDEE